MTALQQQALDAAYSEELKGQYAALVSDLQLAKGDPDKIAEAKAIRIRGLAHAAEAMAMMTELLTPKG